jgi:hypothetical protein
MIIDGLCLASHTTGNDSRLSVSLLQIFGLFLRGIRNHEAGNYQAMKNVRRGFVAKSLLPSSCLCKKIAGTKILLFRLIGTGFSRFNSPGWLYWLVLLSFH